MGKKGKKKGGQQQKQPEQEASGEASTSQAPAPQEQQAAPPQPQAEQVAPPAEPQPPQAQEQESRWQQRQMTAGPEQPQLSGPSQTEPSFRGRGRGRGRGGRGRGYAGRGYAGSFDTSQMLESLPGQEDAAFPSLGRGRGSRVGQGSFPSLGGQEPQQLQQPYQPAAQQMPQQVPQQVPQHVPQQIPQQAPQQVPRPATAPAGARAMPPMEGASSQGPPSHLRGRKGVFQIPTRKHMDRAGTLGKQIAVRTNHLPLDLSRLKKIAFHYDVAIDPDKPKRLLRWVMEEFRNKNFPQRWPAFDGRKNLYSSAPLPFHKSGVAEISDTVKILDPEMSREKEYKVTVKFARDVDLSVLNEYMKEGTSLAAPQQALQVLDIVLRSAPALRFVPVGRSYFTPPAGRVETLGDGFEIWYGLFQSVVLGWKPFLNVDVVHKGFPSSQNAVNALCEICPDIRDPARDMLNDYNKRAFQKFIKGLKIDYQLPGIPNSKRTYKVNDLMDIPQRTTFPMEGNVPTTVLEYFTREKRIPLRYPNLPCLWVGSLNRSSPIYLPLEFCTISAAQVTQRKLNEKQTSCMIRKAATSTDVRQEKIRDAMNKAAFNRSNAVQEFGLTVNESFTEVKARIIDPPDLEYDKTKAQPVRGVWQPNRFLQGKSLDKWTILVLDNRSSDDDIRRMIEQLKTQGRRLGMEMSEPSRYTKLNIRDNRQLEGKVREFLRECKNLNLVVVVVSELPNIYATVKQVAELNIGVLTQCIKSKTLLKMNFATAQNLLLKINSKLNGINHTLVSSCRPSILNQPVMIVGADVTHPSPEQTHIPSVAAVCASHDPKAFKYNTQFRLQPPTMEIIADLQTIMKEHLIFFYRQTGQKPIRIIFYRDGVSEGQFQEVLDQELRDIRNACASVQKDGKYNPAITFLVVQKRHHTRFFPRRREEGDGRNNNVMPGTIVDTTITHPTEKDFYLVSHASIQGVSRPTRYRCLWDDNDMSDDDLEQLTYYLCHLFSRCTRSVSYPAPTYYAHLAAYRARVYIEGKVGQSGTLSIPDEIIREFKAQSPMYFV